LWGVDTVDTVQGEKSGIVTLWSGIVTLWAGFVTLGDESVTLRAKSNGSVALPEPERMLDSSHEIMAAACQAAAM